LRQFYLETDPDHPPRTGDEVTLDADESRHLLTVLRGGRDIELRLTDGHGHVFTARPLGEEGRLARLEILTVTDDPEESALPRLVLGCAVVKGRRFEWVLEKAVELGAHRIVPLKTERGVIDPGTGKADRWGSILKSALKQSGRTLLTDLEPTIDLDRILKSTGEGMVLFGAVSGEAEAVPWADLLQPKPEPVPESLTILIGPEGGWTPGERETLIKAGARAVELGPHVLRTETAAVAGLAALQALRQAWHKPGAS
jgi:16S rRNA (uracil1498-N3)-methyltransferase